MAVLAMGLLAFGVTGCSGGKIFGIQIGSNGTPTPRPGTRFLEEDVIYPLPKPFRTLEEIKVAGEEVTIDDVKNALEYLTRELSIKLFEDEETAADHVTAQFLCIKPTTYIVSGTENFEEYDEPFYTENWNGEYAVDIRFSFSFDGIPLTVRLNLFFPNEFSKVLEALDIKSRLIDQNYLEYAIGRNNYGYAKTGKLAYKPVVIDEAFLDQVAEQGNIKGMEAILTFIGEILNDFDNLKFNGPLLDDPSILNK